MPRLDYSGSCPALLLEPQRTNLIRHSEYFLGENNWFGGPLTFGYDSSILNPENYYGCTTAIGNNLKRYSVINGVSVGTKLSYSIFAKSNSNANFTLGGIAGDEWATFNINAGTLISQGSSVDSYDIVDYSNGWRKYVVNTTFQDAIGNGHVYVNISWNDAIEPAYLYGLQLEQDATYPTSYIPTYGVSQTRLKDSGTAGDISSIVNSPEGTIFTEFAKIDDFDSFQLDDGSLNNRITLYPRNDTQTITFIFTINGVEVIRGNPRPTGLDTTAFNKYAIAWGLNDFRVYVNGLNIYTSTSNITFGSGIIYDLDLIGANHKQFLLFPTALSDDECITLTTI